MKRINKILLLAATATTFQGCAGSNGLQQSSSLIRQQSAAAPIATAKAFVKALINDDRNTVEKLTAHSKNMLNFIYGNPKALQRAKRLAKTINPNSWRERVRANGSIEVTAQAYDDKTGKFPIVFELMPINNNGQRFYISDMH